MEFRYENIELPTNHLIYKFLHDTAVSVNLIGSEPWKLRLQASPKMCLDSSFLKNQFGLSKSLDYRPQNELHHILAEYTL